MIPYTAHEPTGKENLRDMGVDKRLPWIMLFRKSMEKVWNIIQSFGPFQNGMLLIEERHRNKNVQN